MSSSQVKPPILLCVATEKGLEVLRVAREYLDRYDLWMCTFEESAVAERFAPRIRALAAEAGIKELPLSDFRRRLAAFVQEAGIQAIVCAGWRFLLSRDIVDSLEGRVIVAHDSLLPKYRGFAPLATALIAGESETGVTYLRVGESVDNGLILWQRRVPIEADDTIARLIKKVTPLYAAGARLFFENALGDGTPQDESLATYSIWRDKLDYVIDWTQDAKTIERTVRAVGPPYLGARTTYEQKTLIIQKATVLADVKFAIRQPGKVWSLDDQGRPTVVCGQGLLRIDEAACDGVSQIPFSNLRVRFEQDPADY